MLFKQSSGRMWDPTVFYFKDRYYMISMHQESADELPLGLYISESADGVHFHDVGRLITEEECLFKAFALVLEDCVVINCGGSSQNKNEVNDKMLFYITEDMRHFKRLEDTRIDPRYYLPDGRWDHMYVTPDENGGYWGHIVAIPKPEYESAWGLEYSRDGIHWEPKEPPVIHWKGIPHIRSLETGGCEKLGEYYYYIGGFPGYANFYPYSIFAFRSKTPYGPFEPCREAFRLCGASLQEDCVFVQNLACFARGKDHELLLSNAISCGEFSDVWMLPMRKVVLDKDQNLSLDYWPQNDALKGEPLPCTALALKYCSSVGCTCETTLDAENQIYSTAFTAPIQVHDFYSVFTLLENPDMERGMFAEMDIQVTQNPCTLWRPMFVGFGSKEDNGCTAICAQVGPDYRRVSCVKALRFTGDDVESETLDVIDASCAGVKGIEADRFVHALFLVRRNMMELYLDGHYVQSYVTRSGASSAPVLVLQNCTAEIRRLQLYYFSND